MNALESTRGRTREVKPLRNQIYVRRLANLKALIKTRFKGKASAAAREMGRSHTYLWQLLNGYRAIGEDSARLIEKNLGLGLGTLDKKTTQAFERNMMLTAQLGGGHSAQIMMVPVISVEDSLAPEKTRRKAMASASEYVPCHAGCTEDAVAIVVDFSSMEPRLKKGDKAIIEPKDRWLIDDKVYWLRVKATGRPVMRVAAKLDTDKWIFTRPREANSNERPFLEEEVDIIGRVPLMVREI